jgi:WhiB family redox-sensing transcriptional regulator
MTAADSRDPAASDSRERADREFREQPDREFRDHADHEIREQPARQETLRPVLTSSYDKASWRDSAACRYADTELFFPIGKTGPALAEIQQAKRVCAGCPVRQACLTFALSTNQLYGIWGGYDEDERRPMHQRWRADRYGDVIPAAM